MTDIWGKLWHPDEIQEENGTQESIIFHSETKTCVVNNHAVHGGLTVSVECIDFILYSPY